MISIMTGVIAFSNFFNEPISSVMPCSQRSAPKAEQEGVMESGNVLMLL